MNKDIVFCEPFILPGILPTLGTPILKSIANEMEYESVILYPSLNFFLDNKIYKKPLLLKAIQDIPLQFVEFLFASPKKAVFEFVINRLHIVSEEERKSIYDIYKRAGDFLEQFVEDLVRIKPKVLVYSLTFGDYNFAFSLFARIKHICPEIKIVCGGSSCSPEFNDSILKICDLIDYIICDEGTQVFKIVIEYILKGNTIGEEIKYISTKLYRAERVRHIIDLDELPCPDFSDFFEMISKEGMDTDRIMVPYEMSRGCWWGSKHPCKMCGYFGNQKTYIKKSKKKILDELVSLRKQGIRRIRFTDLVAPVKGFFNGNDFDFLGDLDMDFYIEFRPNMKKSEIENWKRAGVNYCQIGLESLSSDELTSINKGTTALNNIYILRNLYSYRIQTDWNYLFGFETDKAEWYIDAIKIMPLLYHLQPPNPRKVWVNKESIIYNESEKENLIPISNCFHTDVDREVFFEVSINQNMMDIHDELKRQIAIWQECFCNGYRLFIDNISGNEVVVIRKYEKEEVYRLNDLMGEIYLFLYEPCSSKQLCEKFKISIELAKKMLQRLIDMKIAIYLDGKYMALATFPTKYRWKVLRLFDTDEGVIS